MSCKNQKTTSIRFLKKIQKSFHLVFYFVTYLYFSCLEPGYVGREEFTVAGSVAGGTDVMTANLFEEGSLFEVSIFLSSQENKDYNTHFNHGY